MDNWTRILLWFIAVGIWINALNPWVLPQSARADNENLSGYLSSIDSNIKRIGNGLCLNPKLC